MKLKTICLLIALSLNTLSAHADTTVSKTPEKVLASPIATVEGITEYRLENGLRILLAPDPSKPTTTVNVTYLVGSRHESYGETGMAHLLEHLLFKGTNTSGNIMDQLSKRGMRFNGSTFYDRTNYYETFPENSENLAWVLSMEADRMVNSRIAKSDLNTEFSVVRNEMEIDENNPFKVLLKQMAAVTFDWHNYGHSTIGARSDVEGVRIENLQNFYRKFYQPDNAVLMVSGKFNPQDTLVLIEKTFGKVPKPTRKLERTWTREQTRDGNREVTVRRISDSTIAAVMYPTSPGSHVDAAAMMLLGEILVSAPNGRLNKALVQTKQASKVDSVIFQLAEPGYATFYADLARDQNIEQAKKTLIETLEGIDKNPITASELLRAKTSLLNDFEKITNNSQALCEMMSEFIALGDWRILFVQRDRIDALTLADVNRVARNYFKQDSRSFGQFVPVASVDRTTIPDVPDVEGLVTNYKGRKAVEAGETFDATPQNIQKRTEKFTLENGAKVALLNKKTRGGRVYGRLVLHLGNESSLFNQNIASKLTANMLMRGTNKYSRSELETKLNNLKASIKVVPNMQNVEITFETIRSNLPEVLNTLQEVLQAPKFEKTEFDQLLAETIATLESKRSDPIDLLVEAVTQNHMSPYQKGDFRYIETFEEELAAYKAIDLSLVRTFFNNHYGASQADFTLVGDFDSAGVKPQIATLFGNWLSPAKYNRIAKIKSDPIKKSITIETPDKASAAYVSNIFVSVEDLSTDFAALKVAAHILGGGPKSRLFARLRQKEGISYTVQSIYNPPSIDNFSSIVLLAMFAPSNVDRVKTAFWDEITTFVKDGITADELADSKKAIVQGLNLDLAQDAKLVKVINDQQSLGRNMATHVEFQEKIQSLSVEAVNAAIRKYIKSSDFSQYFVGDFKGKTSNVQEK